MRQRLIGGAKAHLLANLSRVIIQLGMVAVVLPIWGVQLYGEWLVLAAVPTYLGLTDLGLFSAAVSDMTMAVARGERDHARDVFQTISRGVGVVFAVVVLALPPIVAVAPLASWFHFVRIDEATAAAAIVMLAVRTLLIAYSGLLYGGFASEGYYGQGIVFMAGITFLEFVGLLATAILGYGPAVAAAVMLASRVAGNGVMYVAMRRRAPWLWLGKPARKPRVVKRLLGAGLATTAIGTGSTLSTQGMVILIGVVVGPASVAIFSTLRTMTRVVIQLLSSISETVAPELARAYGKGDSARLRKLHRRASQIAVWAAVPLLTALAIFGSSVLGLWTDGLIGSGGWLLYLFLIGAAIDTIWFTSGGILYWTNRHQRVAVIYIVASLATLVLAYVLLRTSGLIGVAIALIALELTMLIVVLRQSLPAAHDTLTGWALTVITPPGWALNAVRGPFGQVRGS